MLSCVSHAEFLRERNELLELLWELDNELRNWRASGAWRLADQAAVTQAQLEKVDKRQLLARELHNEYNCQPWHFNPDRDNCWLVRPQVLVG